MLFSIRWRLLLSHLAVIILAMGLSGLLLLSSLERYFLEATEESLAAQAQITARTLIPGAMVAGPQVETTAASSPSNVLQQRQLSNISINAENLSLPSEDVVLSDLDLGYLADSSVQLGTQLETRIRILDTQGIVLVDSLDLEGGADLASDTLVAQALNGEYAITTDKEGRAPSMSLALPIMVEGQLAGVVYLSQPLRDVTVVLRDLQMRLLLSTLIALLLSGIVGLLLSGAITRPLRQLTSAAGKIAHGQFDTAVPVNSRDELGRLSRAFNDMASRLQSAHQMQVDFVANVSHELRTPLTSVKGMAETLQDGAVEDLEVRDRFLGIIEQETDRLIRLVNDLLTLSRADSEALNLRLAALDIESLAQDIITRFVPRAEDRGLQLTLEARPGIPSVWADPDRISQVLVNLLDNALKYSRPGGRVTITIEPHTSPDKVLVKIHDQGIGIPAEDLPSIGQRFYRADRARSRAQGGSGLGLAIAQALIHAHKGELWLESQEGVGTTAFFTLPVA